MSSFKKRPGVPRCWLLLLLQMNTHWWLQWTEFCAVFVWMKCLVRKPLQLVCEKDSRDTLRERGLEFSGRNTAGERGAWDSVDESRVQLGKPSRAEREGKGLAFLNCLRNLVENHCFSLSLIQRHWSKCIWWPVNVFVLGLAMSQRSPLPAQDQRAKRVETGIRGK